MMMLAPAQWMWVMSHRVVSRCETQNDVDAEKKDSSAPMEMVKKNHDVKVSKENY